MALLMKNELIHGDALTVLPTLLPGSFDALITDPPYASGARMHRRGSRHRR